MHLITTILPAVLYALLSKPCTNSTQGTLDNRIARPVKSSLESGTVAPRGKDAAKTQGLTKGYAQITHRRTSNGRNNNALSERNTMKTLEERPQTNTTFMTITQAANMVQVDRSTIYRLAKRGEIPAIRIGNVWRVNMEEYLAGGGSHV